MAKYPPETICEYCGDNLGHCPYNLFDPSEPKREVVVRSKDFWLQMTEIYVRDGSGSKWTSVNAHLVCGIDWIEKILSPGNVLFSDKIPARLLSLYLKHYRDGDFLWYPEGEYDDVPDVPYNYFLL